MRDRTPPARSTGARRLRNFALALAAFAVAGCEATVLDHPIPTSVDGSRGYGMSGFVQGTGDEEKARGVVIGKFEHACGGPAVLTQFRVTRADNGFGVKNLRYEAVGRCER